MDIYGWTEQQRNHLAQLDRKVNTELARAYRLLTGQAGDYMSDYERRYARFLAQNGPPPAGVEGRPFGRHYAFQQERMEELARQLAAATAMYYETSTGAISDAQSLAVRFAQQEMAAFGEASAPSDGYAASMAFATLPDEAIASMVGFASDGTPLDTLLRQRASTTAQDAKDVLTTGVAFGHGADRIARDLDDVVGQAHWKNLMLARTETARAHHEAARMQMLQNADILGGWRWSAAVDTRTCPICWANHNRVFPIHQIAPGDPGPVGTAQHKGLADAMTKGGMDALPKGQIDAEALPTEAKAPAADRARTALRLAERADWRRPDEAFTAINPDTGEVVFTKSGTDDEVGFTVDEIAALHDAPGAIGTHNHPYGWRLVDQHLGQGFDAARPTMTPDNIENNMAGSSQPEVWRGNSLSMNDLALAYETRLSEMRAVSPGYVHSIRPPVGQPHFETRMKDAVVRVAQRINVEVRADFMDQIRQGTLTTDQAEARHYHEVMSRVARETGIVYSRLPIRDALGGFTDDET